MGQIYYEVGYVRMNNEETPSTSSNTGELLDGNHVEKANQSVEETSHSIETQSGFMYKRARMQGKHKSFYHRGLEDTDEMYSQISPYPFPMMMPTQNEEEEEDESLTEYELIPPYQMIAVRGVNGYHFDSSVLQVKGFAYFKDFPVESAEEISRSILVRKVLSTGEETEYKTVYEFEADTVESDDHAYEVTLDFGTMNDGHPLNSGQYELFIRLKQFIDERWVAQEFKIGKKESSTTDFSYSTKNQWYQPKTVSTYSFVAKQKLNSDAFVIYSTKLSEVDPASLIVDDEVIEEETKKIRNNKRRFFRVVYNVFAKILPVKRNQIAFLSDARVDLTGNFEYIYNELRARNSFLKPVFFLKKSINEPKTLREYIGLAKAIATSRYVLLDDFYPLIYPLEIRKGVDLIQVWHAVGAFKTFGFSRVGMQGGPKLTSKNHRNYSKAIVSSSKVIPNYAEGFGIDSKRILPLGAARTDMFFDETKKNTIKAQLFEEMPFLVGKKVILFAPTFRGNGQNTAYYPFNWLDYHKLYEQLAPQGFIFLFKIHPFVKNSPNIPYEYSDFFYDVSDYREVNDLLLLTDVMITDYSSVVFEYSLLRRKTIFFAPDLSDYMTTRNFYVDYLSFIPGPRVSDTEHLIEEIEDYNSVDTDKLNAFLNYYFEDLDGHASKRFVDMLEENIDEHENDDEENEEYSEDGKWIPKWGEKASE